MICAKFIMEIPLVMTHSAVNPIVAAFVSLGPAKLIGFRIQHRIERLLDY
jgi:hypothetical protein